MSDTHVHVHCGHCEDKLLIELKKIYEFMVSFKEEIMANQQDLELALVAAAAKVDKIEQETKSLLTAVATLTDAVVAAGQLTPEVEAALASLQVKLDVVDGLVEDVVVTP